MVPAGVELIACRVDVVAEWCYCICAFSGAKRSMREYPSLCGLRLFAGAEIFGRSL